jgi:hypothetical protein
VADWTTVADIEALTGVAVTLPDLKQAQSIVSLFADTTTAASDGGLVSVRNLRLLAWAVGWQAAWMREHPDVMTSTDVTAFSQDGMSSSPAHPNAHLLAPLAKRCLDRLTWHLAPLRAYKPNRAYTDTGTRNSAARDDDLPWVPA